MCRAGQPLAAIAASRYALGADGVGAARPGAHCAFAEKLRTLLLGGGDVEDVVRCALLETLVVRRVSSSCQGKGWKGVVK